MILLPERFHCSKSLKKVLNKGTYTVKFDEDFSSIIEHCSSVPREGQQGTWINEDMKKAYNDFHAIHMSHCVGIYREDKLMGGLYGVSIGGNFFGESMFSLEPNASKLAFYWLCEFAKANGISLIDCQLYTKHLASLGAFLVTRQDFEKILPQTLLAPTLDYKWEFTPTTENPSS